MNRYVDITPSAYDPMSMQEIMMAPLTKRKQHDETNTAYQQYLSELAKVDPSDRDWEEAVKEKDRLSKQILESTELLNKEGYNNRTSSNLLNLNREYQDSISATGKIGMFNANNAAMKAKKAEYLDNVVKQGFTAEDAQYWLTEAEKDYNNSDVYDEKGRVTGFSTDKYMPSKYVNDEEWRMKIFEKAGIHEEDFARSGSQIVQDEKGNYVINSGSNWGSSTNLPNLEAGLKYIENELNRKDSDIRKSLDYQRKSIDDVLSNSENLKNIFVKSGVKDHRESSISSYSPPAKGEGDNEESDGLLYESLEELAPIQVVQEGYSKSKDFVNNVKQRMENGDSTVTPEEIARMRDTEMILSEIDYNLTKNSKYKELKSKIENNPKYKEIIRDDNWRYSGNNEYLNQKTGETFKPKENINLKGGLNSISAQMRKIEQEVTAAHKTPYERFVVDKTAATGDYVKRHTAQVIDEISRAGANSSKFDIDSYFVGTTGNAIPLRKGGETHSRKAIFDALAVASSNGKAEVTGYYVKGASGTPMVEVKFIPNDNFEIDGSGKYWDSSVKKGEPVTVRIKLKDFQSNKTSNINNLVINGLEKMGGSKGRQLAQEMRLTDQFSKIKTSKTEVDFSQSDLIKEQATYFQNFPENTVNLYKDPVNNKYQYYLGEKYNETNEGTIHRTMKWSDVITPDIINSPNTASRLPMNVIQEFKSYFEKNNPYGINTNNIKNVPDAELDLYLKDFIEKQANNPIEFSSKERALNTFKY